MKAALCYKCGYPWNYKGKQRGKSSLSCPKCSYRLVAEKAIIGDLHSSQEELHTYVKDLPKKNTYIHSNFERISSSDGFSCLVDKRISKQFKEAPEDLEKEVVEEVQEEPLVKILPPKFDIIRVIPRDPINLLKHQEEYGKWI